MQLTILDFKQLEQGSIRSQRILRVRHWMQERAGRFLRLGSVGVAGDEAEVVADAGAEVDAEAVDANVAVSISISLGPAVCAAEAVQSVREIAVWAGRNRGQGRE